MIITSVMMGEMTLGTRFLARELFAWCADVDDDDLCFGASKSSEYRLAGSLTGFSRRSLAGWLSPARDGLACSRRWLSGAPVASCCFVGLTLSLAGDLADAADEAPIISGVSVMAADDGGARESALPLSALLAPCALLGLHVNSAGWSASEET